MKQRLQETADHLREDVGKIDEPQAKALFLDFCRGSRWANPRFRTLRKQNPEQQQK
jgi:hypothetical protein